MANKAVVPGFLALAALGVTWGCAVDPAYPPAMIYGTPNAVVYGAADPYYGDPFWNSWGGGYYGGFYGRGFGGTRLYHGAGNGAARGGGVHGGGGGRRGR